MGTWWNKKISDLPQVHVNRAYTLRMNANCTYAGCWLEPGRQSRRQDRANHYTHSDGLLLYDTLAAEEANFTKGVPISGVYFAWVVLRPLFVVPKLKVKKLESTHSKSLRCTSTF